MMFKACMIDGFGWFEPSDYRRAWLLFDEVEYILPGRLDGPLWYPFTITKNPEYRAEWLQLGELRNVAYRLMRMDYADKHFHALVNRIPKQDLTYARNVVNSDADLRDLMCEFPSGDLTAAVSALTTKLLLRTATTGALPIVGKEYAWSLLARKLESAIADPSQVVESKGLLNNSQGTAFSRFAAGLSLEFLNSPAFADMPFDELRRFKDKNRDLLQKHQLHMAEVAQDFNEIPDGASFESKLRALRLSAASRRIELDAAVKDAWRTMGFELGKKAVEGALAALPPLLMLSQQRPIHEVLIWMLPASAIVASNAINAAEKVIRAKNGRMAYLFEAEQALDEPNRGAFL
jgi:hypothetical protein